MVIPVLTSPLTTVMTSLAVNESRPEVGSSRKSTRGLVTSAMPMLTRLACPPLMPRARLDPMRTSRQGASASCSMTALTLATFVAAGVASGFLSSAVYISISATVRFASSVSNCST